MSHSLILGSLSTSSPQPRPRTTPAPEEHNTGPQPKPRTHKQSSRTADVTTVSLWCYKTLYFRQRRVRNTQYLYVLHQLLTFNLGIVNYIILRGNIN